MPGFTGIAFASHTRIIAGKLPELRPALGWPRHYRASHRRLSRRARGTSSILVALGRSSLWDRSGTRWAGTHRRAGYALNLPPGPGSGAVVLGTCHPIRSGDSSGRSHQGCLRVLDPQRRKNTNRCHLYRQALALRTEKTNAAGGAGWSAITKTARRPVRRQLVRSDTGMHHTAGRSAAPWSGAKYYGRLTSTEGAR